MAGSKVFLTYKRKLSSSGNGAANRDGCHSSLSGGPNNAHLTRAQQPDGEVDELKSEYQPRIPLILHSCAICGVRGNLLQCSDCHQSYHHQCLDSILEPKHFQNGEKLSCRCEQQGSSGHESDHGRSELASLDIGESGIKLKIATSKVASATINPYEGSPDKGSSLCLESFEKSTLNKPAYSGTNNSREETLPSPSRINPLQSMGSGSPKSSIGGMCKVEYDANSSILEASNAGGNNSISTNISSSILNNFPGKSKSRTLITFSRRCKKKTKITVLDAKESPFHEVQDGLPLDKFSISACSAAPPKDCYADQSAMQKLPEGNTNTRSVSCQIQDKVKVDSGDNCGRPAQETGNLLTEREESRIVESVCEDNIPSPGRLPHHTSETATEHENDTAEDCSQINLKSEIRDPRDAIVLDGQSQNHGCQEKLELHMANHGKENIPCSGLDNMQPCSDLPKTRSSGTLDSNMDVDNCKEFTHGASETHLDSRESVSRSHATVCHGVSNCEPAEGSNAIAAESHHVHPINMQDGASSSMQEIVGNSKVEGGAFPFFTEDAGNCLQLFSEKRGSNLSPVVGVKPEVIGHVTPEEVKCVPEIGHKQTARVSSTSSLNLDLSLKMEPKMGNCSSRMPCSELPPWNSSYESGHLTQTPNHRNLVFRQRLLLDRIANRASRLNAKGAFSFQDRPDTALWSEQELDSLWIGVRRHGRGNWHTILRDPRLHFPPWRTAKHLSEKWDEEQVKLLDGKHTSSQLSCPITRDISAEFSAGTWRECLGSEFNLPSQFHSACSAKFKRRSRNVQEQVHVPCSNMHGKGPYGVGPLVSFASSRGNLPHWLKEAVSTPPRPMEVTQVVRTCSHSCELEIGLLNKIQGELKASELQLLGGSCLRPTVSLGMTRNEVTEPSLNPLYHVNKPDDVVMVDSGASSEETISDDQGA